MTTTAPITVDELRRDVVAVLERHGVTLEQFLAADIDDLEGWELRELWLMTRDALVELRRNS